MSKAATQACLKCVNSDIDQSKWLSCLSAIHRGINNIQNARNTGNNEANNELIVISIPSSLNMIKQSIEEVLSIQFPKDCLDIMAEYIIPNPNFIEQKINKSLNCDGYNLKDINEWSEWTANKHSQLIQTEAIIIIHTKSSTFKSVPRNVSAFIPQLSFGIFRNNWKFTWHKTIESLHFSEICSTIAHSIAKKYFRNKFVLENDWSHKVDFSDTLHIGYLCDDGCIAVGTVTRQNSYGGKIMLGFMDKNMSHFGSKWAWITVPNQRILRPTEKVYNSKEMGVYLQQRNASGFYSSAPRQKKRKRSQLTQDTDLAQAIAKKRKLNDQQFDDQLQDLEKAIAESLKSKYVRNGTENEANNHNRNIASNHVDFVDFDDDDLQKAIALSLLSDNK